MGRQSCGNTGGGNREQKPLQRYCMTSPTVTNGTLSRAPVSVSSATNTLMEDGPYHSPSPSSFLFRFLFFVFPFFLSFFVSYILGSSAAVLDTVLTVKDGYSSPVSTSYSTRVRSSDPVFSLSSATHKNFILVSCFLETAEHVYCIRNQLQLVTGLKSTRLHRLLNQYCRHIKEIKAKLCVISGFDCAVARSAHFWNITRRRVLIHYRRFGTTYQSSLQG
jgi:hypothetical protein